jgi:hypothetical protein
MQVTLQHNSLLARTFAATMPSNRSTTCSNVRPSVSTSTASAAFTSAPTGRFASRWSRSSCWARTSSNVIGSLLATGRKKDLALCVRKRDRPLVPPLGDDIASSGNLPLQFNEPPPHGHIIRRQMHGRRNLARANRHRHIFAIEQRMHAIEVDRSLMGQLGNLFDGIRSQASPQCRQRHRPIHGPSIQERKAQPLSQQAADAALSRSGGSIDGDNHARLAIAKYASSLLLCASEV